MIIIVDGAVDKERLLESLWGVEEEEEAKAREPFEVPFQQPCPPFVDDAIEKEVEFADGMSIQ